MVAVNVSVCPICGNSLKYFDSVKRIVRTKMRITSEIKIRRMQCTKCGRIHREIPKNIFPYKQYEVEIIKGVIEGIINSNVLGFEDYPCEMTMHRWRMQRTKFLL